MIEQEIARKLPMAHVLAFLVAVVLGLGVALLSVQFVEAFMTRGVTYLLITFLSLLVFIPITQRLARHSLDLAEPGIWFALFYFAHFGMRAVYDVKFGSPFLGFGPGAKDLGPVNTALAVSILGLLFFWAGYHHRVGRALARSLPGLPRRWNNRLVLPVALSCAIFGWGLRLVLIFQQTGNIGAWLVANKDVLMRKASGITYLNILSGLATVALFVLFVGAMNSHKRRYWLLFSLLLMPELAFRFISGSRSQLVFLLLSLLIAYYMTSERTHKVSVRLMLPGILLGMFFIVLFPILSTIRFQGIDGIGWAFSAPALRNPTTLLRAVGHRLHGLDSLALIVDRVPDQVPHTLGSELGLLAVAWIPRKLWPEKPVISIGEIFREKLVPPGLYGEGTSVSVTLPGEFYWDLGLVGVIIGMMIVGVLWRFLYEYLVQPRGNLSNALFVAVLFPSFVSPVEQTLVSFFTAHLFKFLMLLPVVFILARTKRVVMEE
ncbi:O-antigen polymerase [Calderihabitans maritimus]|uniref:Oligosaccharide repeat unit polymerase n=1 Tax=Calderihabitans maritimus TaxID=1246530 RepID=A0A1Z5HWW2_9FIRM|nr:O-antigen polymerase [Calderihabitans maritimus]GAW94023.1 hypothetical protein KKC1_31420 [Calderihabitans maritimus]